MSNEEQERRIRRENCGRIEDNIQRYKRLLHEFWPRRSELDARIQNLQSELSDKEVELRAIESSILASGAFRGIAGAAAGLFSAVKLANQKNAVENKISYLKSEIQKAERTFSRVENQIDDYEYNFNLSQDHFHSDKCWEVGFSSENLNMP